MITPYAIIRTDQTTPDWTDHRGEPLQRINHRGLTLLCTHATKGTTPADAFMDILCTIHDHTTCLPARLDEPLDNDDAARRFLEAGQSRFDRLLDELEGCDEWSIRVHPPAVVTRAQPKSPAPTTTPGASYLEAKRTQFHLDAGMTPGVARAIADLSRALSRAARGTRTFATPEGHASLALLIERNTDPADAFRRATKGINAPCTLTGPWPPFSFVSIDR